MARPQNGVNGSIPQQQLGFIQNQLMQNPAQRTNNPAFYGYSDLQQVVSNPFLSQNYPAQYGHGVTNNIRTVAPMVNHAQFYSPYTPQSPQCVQYPFQANYIPSQTIMYPIPPATQQPTVNYPTASRKLNPLTVVDPVNRTDLDLSKYQTPTQTQTQTQTQTVAEHKTKSLLLEPHKYTQDQGSFEESVAQDAGTNIVSKVTLQQENIGECVQNEESQENMVVRDMDGNIIVEESTKNVIDSEYSHPQELRNNYKEDLSTEENNEEKCIEDINEGNVEESDKDSKEEINKQEAVLTTTEIEPDANTQGSNYDEESQVCMPEEKTANYYLHIDKKESDETILKRKLIYDREYLITLKSNMMSQKKPQNFPGNSADFVDIIYSESQNITCTRPDTSSTVSSNIDRSNKKQTSKYLPTTRKFNKPPQPKQINLNINENQVLKRLKSSYLPPQLRIKEKELDPYIQLKRNIKCNLNKITPQNFQDCLSEMSKLNIKEKDEMSCLISEIFIKAVQEEAYSVTYAQFCNKLAQTFKENAFKSELLKKCQDMFQTPIQEQLNAVRKDWTLKIDSEVEPKMKILYESDLEEQVKKAKDRYFGNIRFIGELFLHHLLAGKVILNCIVELLKGKNDIDALLALCKLMETCGKQIDERHKDNMNSFIKSIDDLSKSKDLETRIRFKLKDIVDMRQRDWTLRHIQQEKKINPKTLEEQKEEAAAEAAVKLAAAQTTNKRSHPNVQSNQVRRQVNAQQRPFAVKNLTFTSQPVDEKTVLGPSRGNWTAGSGSKSKSKDSDSYLLSSQKYMTNPRSPDQSPQIKMKNRYRTFESSTEGSGADSRSSSPLITDPKNTTNKDVELTVMSDDARSDLLFNNMMLNGKFDVDSWSRIDHMKPVIEKWIDDMMEKDAYCRRNVGESFNRLLQEKIISQQQLIDGTQSFVSGIGDLICDIPKLWEFFSQFLEQFIYSKNSDISFFQNMFKDLIPSTDVALCFSMTLHAASSRLGHNIVGQVFHKSTLKWENIVPGDWKAFVESNNLNFTISGGAPLSQCGGYSLESISDSLQLMLADDMPNEGIFEYLEKHIDKPTWKSIECVRTITICILKAMRGKPKHLTRVYLKDKSEIIKQITQNKIDNELEILKSILEIADELDKEILTIVYDVIMTGKIVSKHAFSVYCSDQLLTSDPNFNVTYQIIHSQLYVTSNHR